jgi:hypothetical protein
MGQDRPAVVGDVGESLGQRAGQVVERAAVLRARLQGAVERRAQLRRQIAALAPERREQRPDPLGGGRGAPAPHRVDAREALVEDERERVEVGALVDPLSVRLLGRHVGERAHDVARAREWLVARQMRDAEVRQLGRRAGRARPVGDDHVLRLDVAMDDAALVRVLERVGEREADTQHVAVGELAVGGEAIERAARDQLRDEEARAGVLPGVEDGDDPGVVQASGGQRLARRPLGDEVTARGAEDDLHRDGPVEPLVVAGVHGPEAAGAQAGPQPVAAHHERRPGGR